MGRLPPTFLSKRPQTDCRTLHCRNTSLSYALPRRSSRSQSRRLRGLRAPQERHLGLPVGYYYSEIGPLNQVMTLWAYETLNERVEWRERLFNDPDWIAFLHKARALVVTQETRILKPASFFNERLKGFVESGKEKRP